MLQHFNLPGAKAGIWLRLESDQIRMVPCQSVAARSSSRRRSSRRMVAWHPLASR